MQKFGKDPAQNMGGGVLLNLDYVVEFCTVLKENIVHQNCDTCDMKWALRDVGVYSCVFT